jgi:hypothetical protein
MYIHVFLTSVLIGGECSASRPDRFTPGERAPGTRCIGGWVGPRAGVDDVEKKKNLAPSGTRTSVYTDCAPLAPNCVVWTGLIWRRIGTSGGLL